MKHEFLFELEYVEDVTCSDDVDKAILRSCITLDRMAYCARRSQSVERRERQNILHSE